MMKKEEHIDLIKGEFSAEEANIILSSIIGSKIKFNNRQIFGMEERNDGDPERYKTRLLELNAAQEKIARIIEEARKTDKKININAEIKIVVAS